MLQARADRLNAAEEELPPESFEEAQPISLRDLGMGGEVAAPRPPISLDPAPLVSETRELLAEGAQRPASGNATCAAHVRRRMKEDHYATYFAQSSAPTPQSEVRDNFVFGETHLAEIAEKDALFHFKKTGLNAFCSARFKPGDREARTAGRGRGSTARRG